MSAKRSLDDLAIFGQPPAFGEPLHVGRPNLPDRRLLLTLIEDALDRRWLTNNGPYVQELEHRLAAQLGVRHCILTSSGTAALELAIRALGLTGEVVVPSFTFPATVNALQWLGITPVFCDIDPATHHLDPALVETSITERTSAILPVHLWGRCCAVEKLAELARRHDLKLLYDASHALGSLHRGISVGGFGDAEVFSFHATKIFHTLEGGALTTDNDVLAEIVRVTRNHGFAGRGRDVVRIGTNAKMSEFHAAMGLALLDDLPDLIEHNRRNHRTYERHLAGMAGLRLLPSDDSEQHNHHYVVVEVMEAACAVHRDHLLDLLAAENVLARRYFHPGVHRMEPYLSLYPRAGHRLPETERLVERVLCLPTGSSVSPDQVRVICDILRLALENDTELLARLPEGRARPRSHPSNSL